MYERNISWRAKRALSGVLNGKLCVAAHVFVFYSARAHNLPEIKCLIGNFISVVVLARLARGKLAVTWSKWLAHEAGVS